MDKDKNEALRNAMKVLDVFYKDTAIMLEILKGILKNEYGYTDISGNAVCRKGSSSLKEPSRWTPLYLSVYLNKGSEYISFAVPLKDFFKNEEPKQDYYIYGCKFFNVKNPGDTMFKLSYYSVEAPYDAYSRTPKDNYIGNDKSVEVKMEEHFDSGKCLIKSLWDMKDRQAVAEFAEQVSEL